MSSRRSSTRAIEADPEAADRVRDGNAKAIGPLVGFVMRETKGRADGGEVTRLIRERLGGPADRGLERRDRRRRVRRIVGRPRARAAAAEAVGPPDPRQRRQLPALHAVSARGGRRARSSRGTWSPRCATSSGARTCASARSPGTTPPRARSSSEAQGGGTETLRYDQLLVALGSVSRSLPIPGLDRHAIGFKSLADAIWLRNHVIETLEQANATEDPARRERAADVRLRRRWLLRPRGARRAPGLRRRRDGPLSAGAPARDALDPDRGHRPGPARGAGRPRRRTRCVSCAAAGSTSASGRGSRRRPPTRSLLSTGERVPTRTLVWTAGVTPHPSLASLALPLDDGGRVRVDEQMRVEGMRGVWAIGDCAAVPYPDGGRACPPTAAMAVRQGPAVARNIAAELGVERHARAPSPTSAASRSSTSAATRRSARSARLKFRGFVAWWMARTYHMSQIPGLARKIRAVVDWTVGLPFARDTAEVGSIGHPRPLSAEVYARGGTPPAARTELSQPPHLGPWSVAPTS